MLGVRCGLAAFTEFWTWRTTHRADHLPTCVPHVESEVGYDPARLPLA